MKAPQLSPRIGSQAEDVVLQHLQNEGWKLIRKNYRCKLGEIDLILQDDKDVIVFVEVKYRSGLSHGMAQSTVHYGKQNHLIQTALAFIKEYNLFQNDFRFDVVTLTPDGIERIENAFSSPNYTF
ncbi:MAG: YraN family protein [Elusimicrobia bacterium]|nr:YraN family protein [Elusimicrobiota bacterium]MBI4217643.1 YraN family protein [Elusimicrobiota bacterium]